MAYASKSQDGGGQTTWDPANHCGQLEVGPPISAHRFLASSLSCFVNDDGRYHFAEEQRPASAQACHDVTKQHLTAVAVAIMVNQLIFDKNGSCKNTREFHHFPSYLTFQVAALDLEDARCPRPFHKQCCKLQAACMAQ